MSDEIHHGGLIQVDDEGWFFASCSCGWSSGPMPGQEDAMDAYGDHRAWVNQQPDV